MQFIDAVARAAWAVLLAHYTKTNDITLSSVLLDSRYNTKMLNEIDMADTF
jgi:hypothetical protein